MFGHRLSEYRDVYISLRVLLKILQQRVRSIAGGIELVVEGAVLQQHAGRAFTVFERRRYPFNACL